MKGHQIKVADSKQIGGGTSHNLELKYEAPCLSILWMLRFYMDSIAPSAVGLESLDQLMTEKFISMTSMNLMTVLPLIYYKIYPNHNFLCTNSKFAQDVKLVLQRFQ